MIDRVPPVLGLFLNHQDALGAFLGMIPGGYIYINPELCKEPRMKLLFREFQGDMRN